MVRSGFKATLVPEFEGGGTRASELLKQHVFIDFVEQDLRLFSLRWETYLLSASFGDEGIKDVPEHTSRPTLQVCEIETVHPSSV
jgi:hypothetical protein